MRTWPRTAAARLVAGLAVIAVGLTACSNASGSSDGAGSDADGTGGTLIVGATFSDLPTMDVVPSQGLEADRFFAFQVYDGLVKFDPDNFDAIVPDLADTYEQSGDTWTFHLHPGVTFTDGTPFNADAVLFNLDRVLNKSFPYYSATMAAQLSVRVSSVASYSKTDDSTVVIKTKTENAMLRYELPYVLFASPTAIQKYGNDDYPNHPVGTGPFKFDSKVARQSLTLVRNDDYWGATKPKLDKIVLKPMPDPAARYAALKSGDVNWAEVPPTDAISQMKSSGIQVLTGPYAHDWYYQVNMKVAPFDKLEVRQAFMYAIDKKSLCDDLLQGACQPADGPMTTQQTAWYDPTANTYAYNPDKAKQLLAQAGYPNGVDVTIDMPSAGSGNMWPTIMAPYIQQAEKAVGINIKFNVKDWTTIGNETRATDFPAGVNAIETSKGIRVPSDIVRNFVLPVPSGQNDMGYTSADLKAVTDKLATTPDQAGQDALVKQASKIVQNDLPWLVIVHDLNLRALAPTVHGFKQPSSWFANLSTVWVSEG